MCADLVDSSDDDEDTAGDTYHNNSFFWYYFLRDASPGSVALLCVSVVSVASYVLSTDEDIAVDPVVWFWVDAVCVVFFIVEYVLRFCYARHKLWWIVRPMSLIDLSTIVPLLVELFTISLAGVSDVTGIKWLRILRLARAARVLKFGPSLRMVQIFVQALLLSVPHITALLFMLLLVDILAAALLREVEDLEVFTDVPVTMWFAIVTMTTLGYGDMCPKTFSGRLIAVMTMLAGVLIFSLPLTVIGHSFAHAVLMDEVKLIGTGLRGVQRKSRRETVTLQQLQQCVVDASIFSSTASEMRVQVAKLFTEYDTDGSGTLTPDEVARMIRDVGIQLSEFVIGSDVHHLQRIRLLDMAERLSRIEDALARLVKQVRQMMDRQSGRVPNMILAMDRVEVKLVSLATSRSACLSRLSQESETYETELPFDVVARRKKRRTNLIPCVFRN